MPEARRIQTPIDEATALSLHAGDRILLSGELIGMRDEAHRRVVERLEVGEEPPISLKDAVLYYVGPAPAKPGAVIGPAGPTTSSRMDAYTPAMLAQGVRGLIGKGLRDKKVRAAIREHRAVYFHAVGGAAALIAARIKKVSVIAYEDLGTEAIRALLVEDMPLIVANDAHGGDVYESGRAAFRRM